VLLINAVFLFIASLISAFNSDDALFPLLYSAIVAALFGAFPFIYVPPAKHISNKEGLMIVVSSWLLSCVVGTLPYLLSVGEFTLSNAWFESISGFTTTGSTILTDIEALPLGLLFWRSATHWLGGMGIIIFVLSMLPSTGNVGMVLYRSEMSSLAQEDFRLKAKKAVHILLTVYIGLTLLETVALLLCGMGLFDAITHSFATIATGGFSPKNTGIAHYNSVPVEVVVIIFMILSGIHFGLLFSVFSGSVRNLWKSTIVRFYLLLLLIGTILSTINMHGNIFQSWLTSLRHASFQIISAGTSTGFSTFDTSIMPSFAQLLFIFFSLQCACAGSTSGGIKVDRIVILGKTLGKRIKQLEHPHAVIPLRINDRTIKPDIIEMSILFLSIYLGVVFLSTLILTALGVDILSAFSGSVATIGNVGPGLGIVGSMSNFSHIPDLGKWVLSITMLIGRLEIFGFIVLLHPGHW
jgi:trk system potassium uptake protein TrkH